MQWEQFVRKALQQFQFDEGLIPSAVIDPGQPVFGGMETGHSRLAETTFIGEQCLVKQTFEYGGAPCGKQQLRTLPAGAGRQLQLREKAKGYEI